MSPRTSDIPEVAASGLCCGCGVCAYIEPDRYTMVDDPEDGRRPLPVLSDTPRPKANGAAAACPGARLQHTFNRRDPALDRTLSQSWGPVYEIWEGHAADDEIRRAGSSGGAATALALYGIERAGMHGVLHTAARDDAPWLNTTVMSRTRADLLSRTGSRYAPASPCDGLAMIERAPAPCVFIGKPCDVAGAQAAARIRPELQDRLGLVIAFFCAGVPSTRATLDLLRTMGIDDPRTLTNLRYRGNGWPGRFHAQCSDGRAPNLSYEDSWDFLQKHRQWRCRICPDHTGEFADIAVGDPWYRPIAQGEPGSSLIVARTPRGVRILHDAARAGHLVLTKRDHTLLARSQPNLLTTRGRLWGQKLALRAARAPAPTYRGFPTFHAWLALPMREKARSIIGTLRRIPRRKRPRTALSYATGSALRQPSC